MKRIAVLVVASTMSAGCHSDFLKNIESGAYDKAATAVSTYCERMDSSVMEQERVEARREIRQRGTEGPAPVNFEGLDEQTGSGKGPVVRIYCHGETVPTMVWKDLIK